MPKLTFVGPVKFQMHRTLLFAVVEIRGRGVALQR